MKKFPALFFVLLMYAGVPYSQERQNVLSLDVFLPAMSPVSYLAGESSRIIPVNIKYQRLLAEHRALMMKMGLNYNWDQSGDKSVDIYPMVGLEWHPYNNDLKGFYIGPSLFLNYSRYSHAGTATANDLTHEYWLAIGGNVGYVFEVPSSMIIDITFGLGYGYANEIAATGGAHSGFRMDETIGGVYIGWQF